MLKHSPADIIKEVGVLLMFLASGIELAKGLMAPSAGDGGGKVEPQQRGLRQKRVPPEARTEAGSFLALARGTITSNSGKRSGEPARSKTKTPRRLRPTARAEDRLHSWAATRGRDVSGLKMLLGFSTDIGQEDAKFVQNRIVQIPSGKATQVRTDALTVICGEGNENVVEGCSDRDPGLKV